MIHFESLQWTSKEHNAIVNHPQYPRGVMISNPKKYIIGVNDRLLKMLGYSDDKELVGQPAAVFMSPPYAIYDPKIKAVSEKFWERGSQSVGRFITKQNGLSLFVNMTASAIKKKGKPFGVYFEFDDISSLDFIVKPMADLIKRTESFARSMRIVLDPVQDPLPVSITPMETQVVILLKKKFDTKQIAKELGIKVKTVENHRASIRLKINIQSGQNLQEALSYYST